MQKAYYPFKTMRITQDENGTYSHAGSLAMDDGGASPGTKDAGYAPADIRIARVVSGSSHQIFAETVEPVLWANGDVDYMNFTIMHDDVIDANVKVGAVIRQGVKFFEEGTYSGGRPGTVGSHMHLEVGRGKSPARQVQNSRGTWVTPGQVHIYDALFIPKDGVILDGRGHPWVRDTDKPTPKEDKTMIPIFTPTVSNLEVFSAPDVNKTIGNPTQRQIGRAHV